MRVLIRSLDARVSPANFAWLGLRLEGEQLALYSETRSLVESKVGPLVGGSPSVIVLQLGPVVPLSEVDEISHKVAPMVESAQGLTIKPRRVAYFNPGKLHGTKLVVEYDSRSLGKLHTRMLRGLASHVSVDLFPTFRAHVTLGYCDGELTLDQKRSLKDVPMSESEWSPASILLHRGHDIVRAYSLTEDSA